MGKIKKISFPYAEETVCDSCRICQKDLQKAVDCAGCEIRAIKSAIGDLFAGSKRVAKERREITLEHLKTCQGCRISLPGNLHLMKNYGLRIKNLRLLAPDLRKAVNDALVEEIEKKAV